MPEADPLIDDELVYRRIPASMNWWQPGDTAASWQAFRPRADDVDGLSVYRAKCYATPAMVCVEGKRGHRYHVAQARVGDLLTTGVTLIPGQTAEHLKTGHIAIPELNGDNRRTERVEELAVALSGRFVVIGTFEGQG